MEIAIENNVRPSHGRESMEEALQAAYCRLGVDEIRNEKTRLGLLDLEDRVPRAGLAYERHRVGKLLAEVEGDRISEQRETIRAIANKRGILLRSSPASNGFSIVPSDINLLPQPTESIFIGTDGSLRAQLVDDQQPVSFHNLASGTVLAVRATMVYESGTSASGLVALR